MLVKPFAMVDVLLGTIELHGLHVLWHLSILVFLIHIGILGKTWPFSLKGNGTPVKEQGLH